MKIHLFMGPRLHRPVLVGQHWKGWCRKRVSGEFGRNPLILDAIRLAHGQKAVDGICRSQTFKAHYVPSLFWSFSKTWLYRQSAKRPACCVSISGFEEKCAEQISPNSGRCCNGSIIGLGLGYCPQCLVLARRSLEECTNSAGQNQPL